MMTLGILNPVVPGVAISLIFMQGDDIFSSTTITFDALYLH